MIEFLSAIFEEMDEMVYISDMESHEIVYMNKQLRESLGYSSADEYAHKKCHEVLQGIGRPCNFCNNSSLNEKKFISWVHKNPVMNKNFLIKDTKFVYNGRAYRIEIAVDVDSDTVSKKSVMYAKNETIINECLQYVVSTLTPDEAVDSILAYIGKTFHCDRTYIFEMHDTTAVNTYEWCRDGVSPQKDLLQDIHTSSLQWWLDIFEQGQVVIIKDIEDIRTTHPTSYAILKPQNIQTLTAGPIRMGDRIMGFIGVDNPDNDKLHLVASLFKVLSCFMVSLLRRRDLLRRLNTMSFRDSLTGAFNRNALFDRYGSPWNGYSLGVVFCDVTGLKQVNDVLGHTGGDALIRHCYELIRNALRTPDIFRSGGDEFVIVFENIREKAFLNKVERLQKCVREDKYHIAVGYAWSDKQPLCLEELVSRADSVMYRDKREYYALNRRLPGVERRGTGRVAGGGNPDSLFYQFVNSTYCDIEQFFISIGMQNTTSYFYFGDMQKDMFYISDNMRDEFGFSGNVVPGLFQDWAKRISTDRDRELYRQEMESMLREKRVCHDLRYRVRTADGRNIWVRCYGMMKWSDDGNIPLFFSGRVTHQDENFVVDPISNFPREGIMFRLLEEAHKSGTTISAIGFSMNHFMEINSTRGRACGDNLIRSIAMGLVEELSDKLTFYRLEGMRFIAVVDSLCHDSTKLLMERIRDVVSGRYALFGVSIQQPCSFALLEYRGNEVKPEDFLERAVSLIRIAKHEVQHEYVEYSESNIEKSKRLSLMALTLNHDVLHGMKNFRVVVQPIVSSTDGSIVGGETLLRWRFGDEDVSPTVFIPLLERNGMIHSVGRWVLEQTVCNCLRINAYRSDFYLSFNVSLHQMSDEHFPDVMAQTLAKYNLEGSHLVAEVTESCMDADAENLRRFAGMCRDKGVRIALDDFGSGYSSFRMLLQYPTDIIKVDRSILGEMTASNEKKNFISSIVYACHKFGKQVCMEGVETREQNNLIKESGCDMIQGFYYYLPMELEEIYHLLAREGISRAPAGM